MKSSTKIAFFLSFLFLLVGSYAIPIQEPSGKIIYYTNQSTPTLRINITTLNEPLNLSGVTIGNNTYPLNKLLNQPGKSYNFIFPWTDFTTTPLSSDTQVSFELLTRRLSDKTLISPISNTPTAFNLQLDTLAPRLTLDRIKNTVVFAKKNITAEYNEPMQSVNIKVQETGKEVTLQRTGLDISNYPVTVQIPTITLGLTEGQYNLTITGKDLAGNANITTVQVLVLDEPISIKLLSKKDNPQLSYYFETNYTSNYAINTPWAGKIYFTSKTLPISIETNKAADCYFSQQFNKSENIFSKLYEPLLGTSTIPKFDSTDGLKHTLTVTLGNTDNVLIGCKSKRRSVETIIIPQNSLFKLEYYNKPEVTSEIVYPTTLVTASNYIIKVKTSTPALCTYSLDNQQPTVMAYSGNMTTHTSLSITSPETRQRFNLYVKCFDRMMNIAEQTLVYDVDTSLGVQIQNSPLYFLGGATTGTTLTLKLSEITSQGQCKVSNNSILTPEEFRSAKPISLSPKKDDDYQKTFSTSSLKLVDGINTLYLHCQKGSLLSGSKFDIIFDKTGPQITNLTTKYGGKSACSGTTCYINSQEVGIDFDAVSIAQVPITTYMINITGTNYSQAITSSAKPSKISPLKDKNISQLKTLTLKIQNKYGYNSSASAISLQVDDQAPQISFDTLQKTISCSDSESGCDMINYGFGTTAITCRPTQTYTKQNISIPTESAWICIEAHDAVDNRARIEQSLGALSSLTQQTETQKKNGNGELTNSSDNPISSNSDSGNTTNSDENPFIPKPSQQSSSSTTILLVSAIMFVILTIGGSGYYAYSKGYLNNQLTRFGIKPKTLSKQTSNSYYSNTTNPQKYTPSTRNLQGGKLESHVSKVKEFLDTRVSKDKGMFDKFDSRTSSSSKIVLPSQKHAQEMKTIEEKFTTPKEVKKPETSTKASEDEDIDFEEYLKKKK